MAKQRPGYFLNTEHKTRLTQWRITNPADEFILAYDNNLLSE
jgi:hypothetical protein